MLRDDVAKVIKAKFDHDYKYWNGEEEMTKRATEECLALMRKLVASKKNTPELMLSEYGKGQNAVVDGLLSELK